MRYIKIIFIISFFYSVLIASDINLTSEEEAYLKEKKFLTVQNLNTFPPFNFNENGIPKGYSVDYMRLIGKVLDVEIKFVNTKTWNESLLMLKNGKLDIIPHISETEERKKNIEFTNFNHIEYVTGVAVHKGENINSIKDLENKILAVGQKTFVHKHFEKNFPRQKLILTGSSHDSLNTLIEEKSDAVIGSLPALNYFIQKNWLSNIKIITIDDLGLPVITKMPMGVSKKNALLKSILDKAHKKISLSDETALKNKWINLDEFKINSVELESDEKKYLENKKILKMCIDPDWMPFEKNDHGKHIGITADYVSYFKSILDVPIEMVPAKSWAEALEFGKQRKCDIFSLIMPTPERRKYLDFTKPYMNIPLIISTKIEQPFINSIPNVLDKPIGVVKGYAYAELLKIKYPNMKLVDVENLTDGLEQVLNGKLFGFIGTLSTVGYTIQEKYIGELKIAGKFDDTWDLGIGVRNDEPILKNIFNKAINTLTEKQKQEILDKWISIKFHKIVDYSYLWELSLVFLIILGVILYKNRSMNRLNQKILEAHDEIQEQQQMVDKYVLILSTDLNGTIRFINEAYSKAIGYKQSELIGKKHTLIHHPDMKKAVFKNMWKTLNENKPWRGEVKNLKKDETEIIFNMYIEPIIKDGLKIGYRSICEDITDKKRIEVLSVTDKLTGLYNRLKLDEVILIKGESFKRYGTVFSIILIDIDDFKFVNDTYGHDVGDYVLKEIARLLKSDVRITDIIGRWGGEEFVIVCESTDLENAYILAENLRKTIANHGFKDVGNKTISLGISEFREGDTLATLFKRTDDALYKAKEAGKNCVRKAI